MVADLSGLYLIRVGDQTFVRQGSPAVAVTSAMHGAKAVTSPPAIPLPDPRDADEAALRLALEALFATLAPDVAAMLAKGQMPTDKELGDAFAAVIRPRLVETAVAEFGRQAIGVGVQFDPAVTNQAMIDWARTYTYELVKGITETTRTGLQQALTEYASTPGMTRGQLEALIRQGGFSAARAEAIAVTEVTRSYSQAQVETQRQMAEAGLEFDMIWRTARDERVCVLCGPLNGKRQPEWGGIGPPPRHVRCRCSTTLSLAKSA